MAVSVRAAFAACLAVCMLTAAGSPPGDTDTALSRPDTTAVPAVVTQSPAYFILQDRVPASADMAEDEPEPTRAALGEDDQPRADPANADLSAEERCLAVAVYYESRGEPLAGQLAVAHVILNRAHSGRFASTLCGVVRQPGQFSFRGRSFSPPANLDWKKAVAVARAAIAGKGVNPARGALYFHASYVAPGWDRAQIAQIGRHVFYR